MKKTTALTMLLILTFSFLFGLKASAMSQYIPKFVSVVYDDSGSVHQNGSKNWAYANYAMQSFCGLLNKQDKLFVTYMSVPEKPVEIDLASSRQDVIDSIRNHSETKDTPFAAIDTAYDVFSSIPNSNKSTQYWLVIITDGAFISAAKTGTTQEAFASQADLTLKLGDMADKKMPNGSAVKIMYLAIGTDAISPDPAQVKNLFLYPEYGSGTVFSGETIVSIMSKIADKVAGKTRLNPERISFIDDKTVKVESKIKLVNIAVLSQKNAAKLISAKIENGKDLNLEQSVLLKYPQVTGRTTDENLNGSISLIGTDAENINAGTYILSFSDAVASDSFAVLFEPALEIRMMLNYPDGREIMDVDSLKPGDTIHVVYKVYEAGTDNEVSLDALGAAAVYSLTYYEDGNQAGSTVNDQTGYVITLTGADIKIASSVIIEGFEPIESAIEFKPQKAVVFTTAAVENESIEIGRRALFNNEKAVRFVVLADGVKLTKTELEALDIKFTTDKHKALLDTETLITDDGTISCKPRYKLYGIPVNGLLNWTSTWLLSTGEIKIIADIAGVEVEAGKMTIVTEGPLLIGANYLMIPLALFFFYGFIFKKRFKSYSKVSYITITIGKGFVTAPAADWKAVKLAAASKWIVIPWFGNRMKIAGVTFYAVAKNAVGIKPKHLGSKTLRLDEDVTDDTKAILLPVSALGNPIVSANDAQRKKQPMIILMSGQGVLVTSDMETGIIYKFSSRKQ